MRVNPSPRKPRRSLCTLAVEVSDGAPPSEFRIFKAGPNETTKGTFTFDAAAAASVMAAFRKHGVEMMIDLEHLSLDTYGPNFDPDARGWCKLEVRDGELWAVDVRWNGDGAARLSEKRQRYISPAFSVDDAGRVTEVLNIAITAMPATHETPALVAARVSLGGSMDPEKQTADILKAMGLDPQLVKKAAKLMGLDESASFADVEAALSKFKDKMTKVADLLADGADAAAESEGGAPAEPPPADPAAAAQVAASVVLSAADAAALSGAVLRLTGERTPSAAVAKLTVWKTAAIEHAENVAKLAADRAALEASERDALAVRLARALGPAMVWADPLDATDPAKRKLGEPFAGMTIEALRAYVAKLPGGAPPAPKPPTTAGHAALSEREIKLCAEKKIDPAKYAETRDAIRARSTRSP